MRDLTKEAKYIIFENLELAQLDISITEMVNKQEGLIIKFIALGHSRDDFFAFSRNIALVTSNYEN